MFEYTLNNHFKFGFNHLNQYQSRTSIEDIFTFEYGKTTDPNISWKAANEKAAKEIYEKKIGDIYILLSGGLDSEICLRSFADQNLPLRAVTLRFSDAIQHEEIKYIEILKKEIDFKHEYIDVKISDFLTSDIFYSTADYVKCQIPLLSCHMWLANQLDGTPIIAQGEVLLHKTVESNYIPGQTPYLPSSWKLSESEVFCSLYMNFILRKKPAIPGFFQYLPEQIYSFLTKNPYLEKLVNNEVIGKLSTRTSKNKMILQFYQNAADRQKLHGFETILDLHENTKNLLEQRFQGHSGVAEIEYTELIKKLT